MLHPCRGFWEERVRAPSLLQILGGKSQGSIPAPGFGAGLFLFGPSGVSGQLPKPPGCPGGGVCWRCWIRAAPGPQEGLSIPLWKGILNPEPPELFPGHQEGLAGQGSPLREGSGDMGTAARPFSPALPRPLHSRLSLLVSLHSLPSPLFLSLSLSSLSLSLSGRGSLGAFLLPILVLLLSLPAALGTSSAFPALPPLPCSAPARSRGWSCPLWARGAHTWPRSEETLTFPALTWC